MNVATSVPSNAAPPSCSPRPRRVDTYAGPALWAGPRHRTGQPIVLLVTSRAADAEGAIVVQGRTNESTLLMPIDFSGGPETASAHIVASYRWLLAQLVPSCDVSLLASQDLMGALQQAVSCLRNSGDEMPGTVGIRA